MKEYFVTPADAVSSGSGLAGGFMGVTCSSSWASAGKLPETKAETKKDTAITTRRPLSFISSSLGQSTRKDFTWPPSAQGFEWSIFPHRAAKHAILTDTLNSGGTKGHLQEVARIY